MEHSGNISPTTKLTVLCLCPIRVKVDNTSYNFYKLIYYLRPQTLVKCQNEDLKIYIFYKKIHTHLKSKKNSFIASKLHYFFY